MKEIILKNGLKIICDILPNTHSISVDLCVRAGVKYESVEENGITHLLEHLHFRELNNFSQRQLYYHMESIGSTLRATTYKDFLRFYMKIRPMYFEKCIMLFEEILTTYSWSDEALEKERAVVMNQINENDGYNIDSIISKALFGCGSLSLEIMGERRSILHMNSKHISTYKRKIFNKNNMALFISGAINDNHMNLIEEKLENIEIAEGVKLSNNQTPINFCNRSPDIILVNNQWNYIDVDISFDINFINATSDEIDILNCILGEGVGSKLQCSIREESNFTSTIGSWIEKYEELAIIHIRFSVDKKLFYDCLSEVICVLNEMKTNLTSKDLDVSLPFYTENNKFFLDDPEETNFNNLYNYFVLDKKLNMNSLVKSSQALNKLMNVAKCVFKTNNMSVAVLGNCTNITKSKINKILLKLQ